MTETSFSLDDLPRFSPWPARLLGLVPWAPTAKTRDEILREFDREKWLPLLERFRAERALGRAVGLDDVDAWFVPSSSIDQLITVDDRWLLMTGRASRRLYLDLVRGTLTKFGAGCPLIELGAGYGGVLLHMLRGEPNFPCGIGLDVCPSGIALLSEIASAEQLAVRTGHCDLGSATITDHDIPTRALIFTSYATSYVPSLATMLIERLLSYRAAAIVQVEPFFEHADDETSLLALLRRRYIQLNGYDQTFLSVLRAEATKGRVEILEERRAVLGVNPLLPASIVVWRGR